MYAFYIWLLLSNPIIAYNLFSFTLHTELELKIEKLTTPKM